MNALKLVRKYARLKNINNITKLDWFIVILNLFILIISIKSAYIGYKSLEITWVNDEHTPDLFDHISTILSGAFFVAPELLWGILGIFGSLMIIHMVLKK